MSELIDTEKLPWATSKVAGVAAKDLVAFPEGTAKLIRLEAGAQYPKHKHPHRTEYVYVLAGEAILTVGHEEFKAGPGTFLTFPPDTIHALGNQSDKEALLFVGAVYHTVEK